MWLTLLLLIAACRLWPATDAPVPLVLAPPPARAYESLAAMTAAGAQIPARDMNKLAVQFQRLHTTATRPPTLTNQPGDLDIFWFKNLNSDQSEQIVAALVYRSDNLNLWLEAGEEIRGDQVQAAARRIETQILPTNRAFFGHEPAGVDGDHRLNILHLSQIGGIGAAYFWSGDQYSRAVNPYSNERNLLYVSLKDTNFGSDTYYKAIAHELQHLIQWHTDSNEEAWLNEGLAELAVHLNGFATGRAAAYVRQTDVQLNTLSHEPDVVGAHYAAAFLLNVYFMDRFGAEAAKALVRHPLNGIDSFSAGLTAMNTGLTFDDLFADWLAATYLHSVGRGQGIYQYHSLNIPALKPQSIRRLPVAVTATVHQYGADFIHLRSDQPLTLVFTGTQQVDLVTTSPYSGDYFWLSYPADEASMSLTRRFDLSDLEAATLTFWTWYDIEENWDYGYVAVSADSGHTWNLLETASTSHANPYGNSLGPGFTGHSGGAEPAWVQQTADLSPYAGQPILLRFLYITDGAVHGQGFAVDDIAVPELGYWHDAESGDDGWEGVGFARTGHILPQTFIVQRLLLSDSGVEVERLPLDENQRGQWQFPMDSRRNEAILIVAGNTPVTRQTAVYSYEIHR